MPSAIGATPLAIADGPRLTGFYADLLANGRCNGGGGLSAKTVRNIHGMLHKAFADAVKWGRVLRNAFLDYVRSDRLVAAWQLLATTATQPP